MKFLASPTKIVDGVDKPILRIYLPGFEKLKT